MEPTRRGIFGVLFGAAVPAVSTPPKSEPIVSVNSFGNVHHYNEKEQRCICRNHGWGTAFGKIGHDMDLHGMPIVQVKLDSGETYSFFTGNVLFDHPSC